MQWNQILSGLKQQLLSHGGHTSIMCCQGISAPSGQ